MILAFYYISIFWDSPFEIEMIFLFISLLLACYAFFSGSFHGLTTLYPTYRTNGDKMFWEAWRINILSHGCVN
jgi:hypothetical protein